MPGFATHYLFGVKNLQQLKRTASCYRLLQSIDQNKTVFQSGLQGPDIFFYYPPSHLKKLRPGSVTHTRWTGDFLKCLIQSPRLFKKREDQQTARAYTAGFIGHYILDTRIHPYVYYMTGTGDSLKSKGYGDHIALESDMDTCLLKRYAGCLPSAFDHGRTIYYHGHTRRVVARALHYAFQTVFPELSLSRGQIIRAICSIQAGTRLTYNPGNYKRRLIGTAEKLLFRKVTVSPVIPTDHLLYKDPLNMRHRQWHNPWNPDCVTTESVPQLIKKASIRYQDALTQLDLLYQTDPYDFRYTAVLNQLCEFLGQQSYHSGLDWMLGE